jgi:hypothetical protein
LLQWIIGLLCGVIVGIHGSVHGNGDFLLKRGNQKGGRGRGRAAKTTEFKIDRYLPIY